MSASTSSVFETAAAGPSAGDGSVSSDGERPTQVRRLHHLGSSASSALPGMASEVVPPIASPTPPPPGGSRRRVIVVGGLPSSIAVADPSRRVSEADLRHWLLTALQHADPAHHVRYDIGPVVILDKAQRMKGKAVVDVCDRGETLSTTDESMAGDVLSGLVEQGFVNVMIPSRLLVDAPAGGAGGAESLTSHRLTLEWKTRGAGQLPPQPGQLHIDAPEVSKASGSGRNGGVDGGAAPPPGTAGASTNHSASAAAASAVPPPSLTTLFISASDPKSRALRSFHDIFAFCNAEGVRIGEAATIVYVTTSRKPYFLLELAHEHDTEDSKALVARIRDLDQKAYQGDVIRVSVSQQSCAAYLAKKPDAPVSRGRGMGVAAAAAEGAMRASAVAAFVPRAVVRPPLRR